MPRGRVLLHEEHRTEELHGEAVRREPDRQVPYYLGDLVPVHLEDGPGVVHRGHEHADEGLPLRAAHGVPHEHHPLPAQPLQRGAGREPRHLAPARLPPPLQVARVVPAVGEAVEPALRERALGAVVERVAAGVVGHPGSVEHVAPPTAGAEAQAQAGVPDEARGVDRAPSPADVAEDVEVERAGEHQRRGGQEERVGCTLQRRARGRPPPPAPQRREGGRGSRGARAPGPGAAPRRDARRDAPARARARGHHLAAAAGARSLIPRLPAHQISSTRRSPPAPGGPAETARRVESLEGLQARLVAWVQCLCLRAGSARELASGVTAGAGGGG
jgi:hypothetical protein